MIFTTMDKLSSYLGQSPALDQAIRYLQTADLTALHQGRNEVDGDTLFVNRFDYPTIALEDAFWEAHKLYGDIHLVLGGSEKVGISHVDNLKLTVSKDADDFYSYEGPVEQWVTLVPGTVLVAFPGDAHLLKVANGPVETAQKVCVKFKV